METAKPQGKQATVKASRPLEGFSVLEWAQLAAGPFCTKLLAGLGAEVIKIEEPGMGDVARRRGPFLQDIPHPERSALFLFLNTSKKDITLNLKTATGRDIFKKLIGAVDMLVAEQPPALVEELGLNYENLQQVNPQLIMASITPFGQTGPYRDYKSYPLNNFHGGGAGYLVPYEPLNPEIVEREALMMGGFSGEYHCGLNAAVAVLAALRARLRLGAGQHIDISKQETFLNAQRPDMSRLLSSGIVMTRGTDRHGSSGRPRPNGIIPCLDGYVNMEVDEERLPALLEMMGNPEWSKDEKFLPENVAQHRQELEEHVQDWAKEHSKEEIWHGCQQRGVPAAAIYTVEDAASSEHLQARGFFAELDHPAAGRFQYPAAPFKLSGTPIEFERAAPLLGEHNEEIYCQRLGYSKEDLALMRRTGVV